MNALILNRYLKSIYLELGWRDNLKIIHLDPNGYGSLRFHRHHPRFEWTEENLTKLKKALEKYYVVKQFEYLPDENGYIEFEVDLKH